MTKRILHKAFLVSVAMLALTQTASAGWRDQINNNDAGRILDLVNARQVGVQEAEQGEGRGDFRGIKDTLEPAGRAVPERALYGDWRCRQMKLGGMSSYIVYSWFHCRISRVNGGIWFQKLDGSLRTAGYLYPENGMWVYLGAASVADEPVHRYSGNGPSVGADATPDDQVGVLTGIGNNRLRIEIPAPIQESDFDAIELVR